MAVYVTGTLGLDVMWSGVALAVAAGLEIPALLAIGRLSRRTPDLALIASGCVAGIAYYAAMAALGYRGVFIACAALTLLALAVIRLIATRPTTAGGQRHRPGTGGGRRYADAPARP